MERREGAGEEGARGKEKEKLVNHIDGFNLHPTHSLKKQGVESQIPPFALSLLLRRALPYADCQADPFNKTQPTTQSFKKERNELSWTHRATVRFLTAWVT